MSAGQVRHAGAVPTPEAIEVQHYGEAGARTSPEISSKYSEIDALSESSTVIDRSVSSPAQSEWQRPLAYFERRMFTDGVLTMPDGEVIRFWGFEDPHSANRIKTLPSPSIRVREGTPVHIKLEIEKGVDGIASPASRLKSKLADAASLKSASYIYQWLPKMAGTWLYQSHESTLKHFEMGMFGLLIVDPEPDATGKPRAYRDGPVYDVERSWVFDDVDPRWHSAEKDDGRNSAEIDFAPKYFLVNGVPNIETLEHKEVAIDAKVGDKILLRLLNASFSLVRTRIDRLHGNIISVDGKALVAAGRPWTKWNPVKAGQGVFMATGARHDLLIDLNPEHNAVKSGDEFLVTFEFLDFAKRKIRNSDSPSPLYLGRAMTRIRVA